jgi:PAS domain S-box-containing protein
MSLLTEPSHLPHGDGSAAESGAPHLPSLADLLGESEERFRALFDDAPVACHEIDREGVVLRVNRAECALLGFDAHEMVGRSLWDFNPPEGREAGREVLRQILEDRDRKAYYEREYTRRDGTKVVLEIHPRIVRDERNQAIGVRSFLIDVTQRVRAEQQLQLQTQELSRSNAELAQFAYVASHDLQEPLRKILAFGDRLKTRHAAELGEEGCDDLARMQNAAARMQVLIQDLLSLSRVANRPKAMAAVDLGELARTVVSDLEPRIVHKGGRVEVGALPVILADRVQIAQLLQNLIGNGLKFHEPGQAPLVKVHGELDRSRPDGAGCVRIIVEDNGIGFDEKYRDRIFQVFQRLHGRSEYEGNGIGLTICRKIAERHGGSISATSAPGQGAKFVVTLPCPALTGQTLSGQVL